MREIQIVILLVFLICSINTLPVEEGDKEDISVGRDRNSTNGNAPFMNPEEMESDIMDDPNINRNALKSKYRRWPNAIIPYVISETYIPEYRNIIIKAMELIHKNTCVRFVPRTKERGYIKIENAGSCKSRIGYSGTQQYVFLESDKCFLSIRNVLHELLHTLGFVHEHTRPDRDKYVKIHMENIREGRKPDFYKKGEALIDNLNVPYDYYSIMHYSQYAANHNGRATITPRQNVVGTLGRREDLSESDIIKINLYYDCPWFGFPLIFYDHPLTARATFSYYLPG